MVMQCLLLFAVVKLTKQSTDVSRALQNLGPFQDESEYILYVQVCTLNFQEKEEILSTRM